MKNLKLILTLALAVILALGTLSGCVFIGWELNGAAFDFSLTPINEDITLTAKWEAQTIIVTFIDYDGWIYKTETVKWGEDATDTVVNAICTNL